MRSSSLMKGRILSWFLIGFVSTMLSVGSRRLASAFLPKVPRIASRRVLDNSISGRTRFRLRPFQLAAKSTSSRKQSLVVHGPPEFSPKKRSDRPFKLVIVESPSKCQTISKILQEHVAKQNLDHDYVVTSCMGHIRNIPQKKSDRKQAIAGIDLEGGKYVPTYTILPEKEQLVSDLQELCAHSQQLILATDDDREGEAMAWHLLQVLVENQANTTVKVKVEHAKLPPLRVRFTEITPKAITESIFEHASTSLNDNLILAQETRRILDRLAGFTVSPILWKKIAPGLSAGRVQSVGMALIVQRERERLLFRDTEYWDVQADFSSTINTFSGTLVSINGSPLTSGGSDFDPRQSNQLTENSSHKMHLKEEDARDLVRRLETEGWKWTVANVTATQRKLNPPPPFITSTLQQEGNKRLGLSVSQSMRTAQQLYEKGYISYMRTDSKHLSDDAKEAIRAEIINDYGGVDNYQPVTNHRSASKKKKATTKPEAQAAHEAIRPAIQPDGRFSKPGTLPANFDAVAKELYQLIYQRTVASHMPPQVSDQTTIRIIGQAQEDDTHILFRTSGSVVIKPGFTAVYPKQAETSSPDLPSLDEGQSVEQNGASPLQHVTQAPARFTEASFVQELEALGVGRPSTYAGTVQILRDRAYVGSPTSSDRGGRPRKVVSGPAISAQRAAGGEEFTGSSTARGPMVPSLTAFVVCSLLEKYCNMYVDPSFTAGMEQRLDLIANAKETVSDDERVAYLDEFYAGEDGLAAQINMIDKLVVGDDARRADLPSLKNDLTDDSTADIGLFVGPWGPYIKKVPHAGSTDSEDEKPVTAQLPPGMASDMSTITLPSLKSLLITKEEKGSIIGQHPEDGRSIRLKTGRFGAYLQYGDDDVDGTTTHTLPVNVRSMKNMNVAEEDTLIGMLGISFAEAVQYVNLPRTVCTMDDKPIVAAIGPYGPYLKYNNTYINLKPADGDVCTIDSETSQTLVQEGLEKKSKLGAGVLAQIGEKEDSMITVKSGRFGMYINWKRVNAKLPPDYMENPEDLPLDEAWTLIQEKVEANVGKASVSKKGKSPRELDLPPGPKRPLSAYLHFCAEKRPEVSERMSSLGTISKELARSWAETSDEDRKPFLDLADISKKEYQVKKNAWTTECQKAGKASKPVATDGIKRPRSSYIFFCSKKRPEVSAKFDKLGDISKELGRQWSETTTEHRQEYSTMAAEDKIRYENEKLALSSKKEPAKNGRSSPKMKVGRTETKTRRGPSAYMLFCAAHRNSIVDDSGKKLPLGETTKRLAKLWKECDDKKREEFLEEAEKQKLALL